jgi:D-arginine dehydrogenase
LRAESLSAAALVHNVSDIEVHELQQAYLRLFKTRAGQIRTRAQVLSLGHVGADWTVETKQGSVRASIVVNAAGAWAGEIGKMAGGLDIGLQPMKRTACLVEPPSGVDPAAWPMLVNAEEQFYLKPDAGLLLLSPSEETPTEPCDAQPDELDIAIGVERVEQATTLQIRRIKHKWAGLRSFVADRCPVVGYDPLQSGLFWVAALGGYGIQTAPAISRLAAALACGRPVPNDILAQGVETAVMLPARLQRAATPPLELRG